MEASNKMTDLLCSDCNVTNGRLLCGSVSVNLLFLDVPDLWSTGVEVEHRDVGDKEGEEEEGGLLTERGVVGEEGDGDAKGEDEEKREEAWSLQHKQRSSAPLRLYVTMVTAACIQKVRRSR